MIHIARKYTHFVFTTFLIVMFFVVYFGAMNYLQMRIESRQSVPEGMMSREDAIERAIDFVHNTDLIPRDHQVWIRDVGPSENNVSIVNYFSEKYHNNTLLKMFSWKHLLGLQLPEGDLRHGAVWLWSVEISDIQSREKWFVIEIVSDSGNIVRFERNGYDSERNILPETSEEDRGKLADQFMRFLSHENNDVSLVELDANATQQQVNCSFFQNINTVERVADFSSKVKLQVCGNRIVNYQEIFEIPNQDDWKSMVSMIYKVVFSGLIPIIVSFTVASLLAFILMAYIVIRKVKHNQLLLEWRYAAIFTGFLFCMTFVKSIFEIGGISYYNHKMLSLNMNPQAYLDVFNSAFTDTVLGGIIAFIIPVTVFFIFGRYLTQKYSTNHLAMFDMFFFGKWTEKVVIKSIVRGLLIGIVLVVTEGIGMLGGMFFLNAWLDFRNPLNTILWPFHLFSSNFGYQTLFFASISEEIIFRLFFISFLFLRYRSVSLALVISSLLWTFSHITIVFHPFLLEQVLLFAHGILLGWVFIRYGLLEVIVAHFFFNALAFLIPVFAIATVAESISLALVSMLPILIPLCVYCFHIVSQQCRQKRAIIGST